MKVSFPITAGLVSSSFTKSVSEPLYTLITNKKGKMGKWISDHVQLCAQALALEEVLEIVPGSIARGYVYYFGSARRDEVALDEALRTHTLRAVTEARQVAALNHPPAPITNWRKCRDCSLESICLPREVLTLHSRKDERGNGDPVSD